MKFTSMQEYIKIREYKDTDYPVILLFPHSGRQYFKDFLKSLKVSEEELRVSEDAYLDYLFSECINQEINSLYANFPRVFVDVNRDPLELDNRDFKNYPNDVTFKDSRLARSGIGLIHTRSVNGKLFYKEKLDWKVYLSRMNKCYYPWYQNTEKLMHLLKNKYNEILIIDCHSMPSKEKNVNDKELGEFVVGDRDGNSCSAEISNYILNYFRQHNYNVSYNQPFSGQYFLKRFGSPKKGINAIQLEIRKDLYMHEKNLDLKPNIDPLRIFLKDLVSEIGSFLYHRNRKNYAAE